MCQIAICNNRKITRNEIERFWNANSDGAGVVWKYGSRVLFKKGIMNKNDLIKFLEKINPPYIVHFRLASIGERKPELTHPFLCSEENPLSGELKKGQLLLFHNGHDSKAVEMLMIAKFVKGEEFNYKHISDTRAIAILISKLGPNILEHFSGKFVVVNWVFNIKTYGRFIENDGILLSNGISTEYFYNYDYFDEERCKFKENPNLCPTKNYHACRFIWPACPYNSWRKINENNNIKS